MDSTLEHERFSKKVKNVVIGKGYEVQLFRSMQRTGNVVLGNYGISPESSGVQWHE